MIGFPFRDEKKFESASVRVLNEGRRVPLPDGKHALSIQGTDEGAELWVQYTRDGIIGMEPHFRGNATMRVGVIRRVQSRGTT